MFPLCNYCDLSTDYYTNISHDDDKAPHIAFTITCKEKSRNVDLPPVLYLAFSVVSAAQLLVASLEPAALLQTVN